MTPLSPLSSPLPALCIRAQHLHPAAQQRLVDKLFPSLSLRLPEYFWDAVGRLALILKELPFAADGLASKDESRECVLGHVRDLMHEIAALKEYLGDMLTEVLPRDSKKCRTADQVKARLESTVSFLFKAPINLVKHERFKLYWLEQSNASGATAGFAVTGVIAPRTTGPASFRTKSVAEGYSFALLLRRTLPTIFELCDIAETALVEGRLLLSELEQVGQRTTEPRRLAQLSEVTESLAALSRRGFPNEVGIRVAELALMNGRLEARHTYKLQGFGNRWRVHFTLPPANAGDMFQLPYWVPQEQ